MGLHPQYPVNIGPMPNDICLHVSLLIYIYHIIYINCHGCTYTHHIAILDLFWEF